MATAEAERTRIDDPMIEGWLRTQPEDPERDGLADDFREQARRLSELGKRPNQLRDRLAELTAQSVDADAKQRSKLVAERTEIAGELTLLPDEAEAVARRYADALQRWAQYVYRQAAGANNDAIQELHPLLERYGRVGRRLEEVASTRQRREEHPDADVSLRAERHELVEAIDPLRAEHQTASAAARAVNAVLTKHFPNARTAQATDVDVERWVANVRRAAAR